MSRYSSFVTKPPEGWNQTINDLCNVRLFLVSTVGPTVFILKSDDLTDTTYKVFIGERQMCSCGGGEARGKLCFHILFVMIKVLRVPSDNCIAWQFSLVDSEIESILSGEVSRNTNKKSQTHSFMKKGHGERQRQQKQNKALKSYKDGDEVQELDDTTYCVSQKELQEDNICCICQEEMTRQHFEEDELCFCESQCGTNFHSRCFRMYATYNRSQKKVIAW